MAGGLRRAKGINWVEVDGDVVAVSESTGDIHVLHGAAAAVWQLLDGETLDGCETLIAETFGVPLDEAAKGLLDAVTMLEHAGIVEPTVAPA